MDTEAFISLYRLSELWDGFRKSTFVKKILTNEKIVKELDLDDLMREWESDPMLQEYGTMAASMLGSEVMIAMPAGFTDSLGIILKNLPMLQAAFLTARVVTPGDEDKGLPKEMLPVVEAAAEITVPPVIIAMKAGEHKDTLKALIGQALNQIPSDVMSRLDRSNSEISGHAFEHLTVKTGKAMPNELQTEMKKDLTRLTGSEEKGGALATKLLDKTAELSWGWVDDYFVISLGPDHRHLKLATATDSVLSHPDVAPRASQFAAKKPLSFSYLSQKSQRSLNELGGVMNTLTSLARTAKTAGLPVELDAIIAELKTLEAKADAIWPNDADAAVAAVWWDGGLNVENFGGPKLRAFDSNKPLALGSLASDKTFLLLDGRANGPFRDKVFGWVEELATSIWSVYQKDVKSLLPDDVRSGAAMGEAIALPMVKELWKSIQNFRAAMGDESALLVNLDGSMPDIPQTGIPADVVAKGKIPRLAWVIELKDRAKLTDSWSGLKTLISSAAAIAGAQSGIDIKTEPVTRKEDGLELFGYELPLDTGDAWPHTAVTGTQWFLSTSPSFTKELAARTPAATGPSCGSRWQINFPALWAFAGDWVKLLPVDPDESEMIEFGISLARSIGSLDIQLGEDNGQSHGTIRFSIRDAE